MRDALISVRHLKKYFPVKRGFLQRTAAWVKAVDGVDFDIAKGETLGLVGESGCGKSTVAKLILKLIQPDAGEVKYEGQDLTGLSEKDIKPIRKKMQIIFQDPFGSLNPRMTVGQTVEEGLRVLGVKHKAERRERVHRLLELAGLSPEIADRYPHEFSGGQRQRVGIARALSVSPTLLVCDEPVSALDVSIQAQILNPLKELQESLGLTYLFISHDLNVVGYMSDRVAVMYLGRIMEYGPAEDIFSQPLHPYTKALLEAVPEPGVKKKITTLSGDVPSPLNPPPGCKFQGRCPHVEKRCRQEEIELVHIGTNHFIRCWKMAQ